jgi:hypothetical protein
MKKIILTVVGLMLTSLFVVANEDVVKQAGASPQKTAGMSNIEKDIKNLSKRAKYYQKKAAKETNKDLAAIYTKCAEAKQKMADGYTKEYENSQKCQTVCASNQEVSSVIKGCKLERKKGAHLSTLAKKIQECADTCLKNAKQAELDGKKELAQQYNEIAAAMKAKAEGLGLVAEGKKEFKDARKELKELKSKVVTKDVTPK